MADVYLSLGSNLANRLENLNLAIKKLEELGVKVILRSPVYETAGWGDDSLNDFLNMVVHITIEENPHLFLKKMKGIEAEMGRISPMKSHSKQNKYQNRTIDLDILYFDKLVIDSEKLQVPHPHMHQRRFVLQPLKDIAPALIHPILKESTVELLKSCPDQNKVSLHS